MKTKSALIADEVALGLWVFARTKPIDDVFVLVDKNAATGAAVGAHAFLRAQKPHPLLVKEILAAQRTNGAKVNHVAGQFVIERLAGKDVNFGMIAPG
jgi:hypothetical protein